MSTATPATLGRRACAALALSSAGLHAAMLGHASNVVAGVLLAAMIVACVYCARDLWLRGSLRAWCLVAVMNLAMVAVHLPMSGAHHITHVDINAVVPQSTIMTSATALSMIEVLIAVAVLLYRTRGNARAVRRQE